jgi:hypothetical protein
MSIVRVGLGETKNFAEGYEAIFGKKEKKEEGTESKPQSKQSQQTGKPKDKKKK